MIQLSKFNQLKQIQLQLIILIKKQQKMKQTTNHSTSHSTNHNQQQISNKEQQNKIKVCIRVRPLLLPQEDEEAWQISDTQIQSILNPKLALTANIQEFQDLGLKERKRLLDAGMNQVSFQFEDSKIEGPGQKTQEIYKKNCKKIVQSAMQGYHGSIMCYGQTTSGKTFTMLGNPQNPGLLPCSLREIFQIVQKEQSVTSNQSINTSIEDMQSQTSATLYDLHISYLEIYNESINDLLNPGSQNLKIQEDQKWGVQVQGLKREKVWNFEQAIMLMNFGEENRIYGETSIHEHSSRSHTIFRIYITSQTQTSKGKTIFRESILNLVDLAGSERLNSNESGQIQGETGYINKSLFTLTNVINKLSENKPQHIPFRDSKLTRLVQSALSGKSLSCIICCISPAVCNYVQSISTLKFAQRAQKVSIKAKKNEIVNNDTQQELQQELSVLQSKYDQTQKDLNLMKSQNFHLQSELERFHENFSKTNTLQTDRSSTSQQQIQNQENYNNTQQYQQQQQQLLQEYQQQQEESLKKMQNQQEYIEQLEKQIENLIEENEDFQKQAQVATQEYQNYQNSNSALILGLEQEIEDLQNQLQNINNQKNDQSIQKQEKNQNTAQQNTGNSVNFTSDFLVNDQNLNNTLQEIQKQQKSEQVNSEMNLCNILIDFYLHPILTQFCDNQQQILQQKQQNNNNNNVNNSENSSINQSEFQANKQDILQFFEEQKIEYKKQLNEFQNDFREQLSQGLSELIPLDILQECSGILSTLNQNFVSKQNIDCDFQLLSQIEEKSVFEDLSNQFSYILNYEENQHLQQNQFQNTNDLELIFSKIFNDFDNQYEQSRNQLEMIFRKKISFFKKLEKQNNYEKSKTTDSLKITKEHDTQLQKLREIYNNEVIKLQEAFDFYNNKIETNNINQKENEQQINQQKVQNNQQYQNQNYNSYENSHILKEKTNQNNQSQELNESNSFTIENKKYNYEMNKSIGKKQFTNNYAQNIFTWGSGKDGRLGFGDEQYQKVPTQLKSLQLLQGSHFIKDISCGYHSTTVLTDSGIVYAWGRNTEGQLGTEQKEKNLYTPSPIQYFINYKVNIKQISTGWQHTLALSESGQAFSWGCNEDGQLGQGDFQASIFPKKVVMVEENIKFSKVSAGHSHSGLISENGSLYLFGCNVDYRLMMPTNHNQCYPVEIQNFNEFNEKVKDIALGVTHTLVLTQNGNVYSAGNGTYGALGTKINEESQNVIIQENNYQNTNNTQNEESFAQNNLNSTSLCTPNIEYFCYFNKIQNFGPQKSKKNGKAIQISAGENFSMILNQNNELFSFGKASYCRLGIQNINKNDVIHEPKLIENATFKNEKIKQICCGIKHASVVTQSGKVYAWGFNFYEQVGLGTGDQDILKPTLIKNLRNVVKVALGHFHSIAITSNGNIYK